MPRTKKTPTSQSLAARATKGPNETPKGSGPSLPPSDLEARVAALEKREHERIVAAELVLADVGGELFKIMDKLNDAVANLLDGLREANVGSGASAETKAAHEEILQDREAFAAAWRKSHAEESAS